MMKTRQLGWGDKRGRPRDTPLPSVTGSVGWAGQPAHPKATAEPGVISWLWENINPLVPTDSLQGKIFFSKESKDWASLVAQRLRICLPMQGTRVRALVREDPTCHGATGPVSHNY